MGVVSPCCRSTPFLWCLPKETVSSRQRKALFYLGDSTIRVSAAATGVCTHLLSTWGWAGAGFWREARLKVSPAFSKAAGCRGGVPARAPLKRGTPLCSHKRRRGSKGEPSPGVPPFSLLLCVCAVTLGGGLCPVLRFDPISLVLAQRNGVEPPKKSAFLPRWLHHSRERYCLGGRGSSSPDLGQGWWSSERLPSPGANGICYGRFARSVTLAGITVLLRFRLSPKARFFGAPPRFFAQEQRNGVELAVGATIHLPRKRRTRTRHKGEISRPSYTAGRRYAVRA